MTKTHRIAIASILAVACHRGAPATDTTKTPTVASANATGDHSVASSPELPVDPDLRTGTLDNGLTYYIRKHGKPEKRALLWLAVDAGSVLEDDDQRGLAHFVEHMAFNGTKRFAKNTLIDFLEKSGMDFGADLNAWTSFDETVYQLTVPTEDPATVARGFDILEDWASAISFDATEVDKERGVVIEEWRRGRGADQRVFDKQWPIFLKNSKYADRKPIGEKEILESAPVSALTRFYQDWYRPELMAVVVVGDVDPQAMEAEIKRRFSGLKNPEKSRPRPNVPVPLLDETRAAVFTDPELNMTSVQVSFKGPRRALKTEQDYRAQLVEDLFHGMLRARLDEIRQTPESPFVYAWSNTFTMGRASDVFFLNAGAKSGKIKETLSSLFVEIERVKRHGFVATELEREQARMLRQLERAVADKDTVDARVYARDTVRRHLDGKAMPGPVAELQLAQRELSGISLDEVNALAAQWTNQTDRVLMASGPARDTLPADTELLAVANSIDTGSIKPYDDRGAGAVLLAQKPTPGTLSEQTIPEVGVTVWSLSNGAKVVVKPTDFKTDEVLFQAFSPGGHSLVSDKRYASARFASDVAYRGGLGEHDAVALRNLLAGKIAQVTPFVDELEEGLHGNASPKDTETMLQLAYLAFTAPRKDLSAVESWRMGMAEFVKNRDLNPQRVFFDELRSFTYKNHLRRQPLSLEAINAVDPNVALDVYRDRFADAGDFTFVIVGSVDPKAIEPMVKTYLASLPTVGRKERWKDVHARPRTGVKKLEVKHGQDPKSFVMLEFHGDTRWSEENEIDMETLADVLEIRLREVLREDMSGVYSVFSHGNLARRPTPHYTYDIGFGCGPENADQLKAAVSEIIASVKTQGVSDDILEKVREKRRRSFETKVKENRFWLKELAEHFRYGTDPRRILDIESSLERVTNANVKAAAKRYLGKHRIEGTLIPAADGTNGSKSVAQAGASKSPT